MYCLKIDIPEEICKIDDELKAIYHSSDTMGILIEIILWMKLKE